MNHETGFEEKEKNETSCQMHVIWENTFRTALHLSEDLPKLPDRLVALKIAIIANTFLAKDVLPLKTTFIQGFLALKDASSGHEAHSEISEAFHVFMEYLEECGVETQEEKAQMEGGSGNKEQAEPCKKTREGSPWKKPGSWCFGDFGDGEGQLEYPVDVLINTKSQFIVLEENSIGKDTVQRIQLFSKEGRCERVLLERGKDGVTEMSDMALDNDENVVVSLKDGNGIGRVNAYNMRGECVRAMDVVIRDPDFPPFFTAVAVDTEDRVLVVEHHEMSVHVYAGKSGKFLFKFGQSDRSCQPGVFDNVYSLSLSESNDIYVCDPFQGIQVFNRKGEFLRVFKPSGVVLRSVIVRESEGVVYGVNKDESTIEVYALDGGAMLRRVGGHGDELGKLWKPMGIAMTADDRIAVAESESHRIQVVDV